jgi:putative FmdB family regulatory protein
MPLYEYACRNCGHKDTAFEALSNLGVCPNCENGMLKRVWSFNRKPGMEHHFNHATGTVVSSMTQFKDELRKKDEQYFRETGIERRSVPVDYADREQVKVTNEGLDSTNRVRRKKGLPEVKV